MQNRISINQIDFGADFSNVLEIEQVFVPIQDLVKEEANYLLFFSDLCDNQMLVTLVHNRHPELNIREAGTTYETWSRMNGGMAYLFNFSDQGCIVGVEKKYVFND